ncbi:FAD-binding dehydrogenase [Flavobacterium faecale]|uniref:FAD-binding dehydrogenase n=1 Tax=Flavobacterium faecale TaxID=1355330 RepID=A0A2S1LI19_9FLAO|nr:FAD-dependent oxidoreductase [Flavobacterium faecale]AWG23281.1 FAD-binding dehydrogenase [Flavobacterium faecale]
MERRKFFQTGVKGAIAASFLPLFGDISATPIKEEDIHLFDLDESNKKIKRPNKKKKTMSYDVVVVGAGMAGISAAVAAARTGAKTVLVQDRPVLGGNASSEVRVTVNGVQGLQNKFKVDRETGIIEEIMIENLYYNSQESYHVWDHVLYDFVIRQPNLTLMLNTQAVDVEMSGDKIKKVICWQLTSETEYTLEGKMFCDCSGDGLMAAMAGAEFRTGREGKAEFGESFAPDQPDNWVMGDCIMMSTKDMGKPVPFYPPSYMLPFDSKKAFKDKHRKIKNVKEGYWWIEVGSNIDIIDTREENRHKLMGYFYGVWDHIKNSGDFPESKNIALDWVGSLPGRRESRRFMGDYILNQKDLEEYKHFPDAVAFGGWSLDEHCPGGIENLDEPASFFHSNFKQIYEVPFRSLYSKNISNLLFAGRNVSVSHMALSSTRIISTCAMMGQAVGTASVLCINKEITPRKLATNHITELQEQLLRDDSYFPNRPANDLNDWAKKASLIFASSTTSGDAKLLLDGVGRDEVEKIHHWQSDGLNAELQLEWDNPIKLTKVEMKFDTNLQRRIMMHKNPDKATELGQVSGVPPELIKNFSVEARVSGKWVEVAKVTNNKTRLVKTSFPEITTTAVRLKLADTHGAKNVKMFEIRCYS